MEICVNCGKENEKWLCSECHNKVDIEKLCQELLGYVPGSGKNDLWDHIASEVTGSYGFRNIVIELAEELDSPRKEYWRMLALAGEQDYLPKNERQWLYQFYSSSKDSSLLDQMEKNRIAAYVISAFVSDYRYEEAERLSSELLLYEELPRQAYCIIGDFYTKTRRYDKAQILLEKAASIYNTDEDDVRKIKKALFENNERRNRTVSGKPEYFPRPKENAEYARKQYVDFLNTIGISVETPEKAVKRSAPKPIPDDMYPDLSEIRKPDFDSFVAFDLETTGIDPRRDSIIQVGAVKVVHGEIVADQVFNEFVKPYKTTVSERITKITGIRQQDVRNAREMWEVIPDFLKFAGDSVLLGYNSVDFDAKFLRRAGRYSNIEIENSIFDVMRYAGDLKEHLGIDSAKIKLSKLAEVLEISKNESHDAYDDALTIAKVFIKLKDIDSKRRLGSEELLHRSKREEEVLASELKKKISHKNTLAAEIELKSAKLKHAEESLETLSDREQDSIKQRKALSEKEASLKENIGSLKAEIASKQKELSGLSFVAFGKKKELKGIIEKTETMLKEVEISLLQTSSSLDTINSAKIAEERVTCQAETEALKEQLNEQKIRLSKLEPEIASLQDELKRKQAKIADIEMAIEKEKAKAEEEACLKAEAEAKAKAEEEARLKAEAEAKAKAEQEARLKAEAEAKAKAEEEARLRAEAEARAKAEEEVRLKAEAEARAKAEEEARLRAEAEARAKAEEEARLKAEAEAKAKAEEEARLKAEEDMRAKLEAEIRAKLEEEMRVKAEEEKYGSRPKIADAKLSASVNKAFDKLEDYYPEHKVFAFDNIDSELRERMARFYKELGYPTVNDMLSAYGFEIISGDAVKELRSFVLYTPGNEPDIIKNKVESMLRRLEEYYPDHVIARGMQTDHKNLAGSVSGLYQWLGYPNAGTMLKAYGFEYNISETGGRPQARDYDDLINSLVEKYKDGPKPKSMGDLLYDNPELKGALKTLQNKSGEVFGMTLKQYFRTVGIFEEKGTSGAQKPGTVKVGVQEKVLSTLQQIYSDYDGDYSYEDAVQALENMNVKQKKDGKIYIFRAGDCGNEVVIPYGIDLISAGAFKAQPNLETVIIAAGLQEIPAEAFKDCIALRKVTIPDSVVSIGPSAFENCIALEKIVLPASLQQIADAAFSGCSSLKNVEMRNPRTLVSKNAFDGSAYEYKPVEEDAATDEKYFKYSSDRKGNITITGFTGEMESISIPGMINGHPVTAIGKGAFQDCQNLVYVTMSDYIGTIQGAAFKDCISLKTIHISNAVSKIISTTFRGCIGLKEVNIPDSLTEITKLTFNDSPIEKLHIGKSLTSIDTKPFFSGGFDSYTGRKTSTRDIKEVTIDPENPALTVKESVVLSKDEKTLLAALGGLKRYTIPEGVEKIADYAFEGLEFLSDIVFPESLISIGERAFAGTSVRSAAFKDALREIKKEAFSNCQKLTAVIFNQGLEEIGEGAFAGSPILSAYLPASLRVLGSYSFNCITDGYGYGKDQELRIDPGNPYLEADGYALYEKTETGKTLLAFYKRYPNPYEYGYDDEGDEENEGLHRYIVKDGTTIIAESAFRRRDGLKEIVLPDGLLSVGAGAFEECYRLRRINIPDSVSDIGDRAFKGTSVEDFVLGAHLEEIGSEAFAVGNSWANRDIRLRNVTVSEGNSRLKVDKKAIYRTDNDGKTSLLIYFGEDDIFEVNEGVSEICGGAFAGNDIQEIHIPASVTTIGENAFNGCQHLVRLRIGFADSDNGTQYAVIYIPEIARDQYGYYTDSRIHDYYMDCIRIAGTGELFDFVKYDSLFDGIPKTKDKILVATDRLKSAIQLVPLYRDQYLSFLRDNSVKAVQTVIEYDDLEGLTILADLDVFTGQNIDKVIELANKTGKVDIISYLMNYKNSEIGMESNNPIINLTLE